MPDDSAPRFRFSAVLSGHSNDVRCLAAVSASAIGGGLYPASSQALVSGSRDMKAKLWVTNPESKDLEWKEERTFVGHTRYVSALAYMNPNEDFPEGLIYTGSMDGVIRAFAPSNSNPLTEIDAHEKCVSAFYISPTGTLLSGSWDHTAKVWVNKLKLVMTLKGHENSIWAVLILPSCNLMVTASADKSIRIWKAGSCTSKITDAHSQAIRAICLGKEGTNTFFSTGNDGDVKLWSVDPNTTNADLVTSIRAHENFIYTMATFGSCWAAAGEHSGLKIFCGEREVQVLPIPAISVWALAVLSNGDIAASASDGRVWVFTSNPRREADEETDKIYKLELSKFQRPAQTELEGVDIKTLPGPSALLAAGKREGQTKMVNDGGVISVHSWSETEGIWTKIGDVVGQPEKDGGGDSIGGAAPGGGKVTYMGKEYDYVFNIELDEGGGKLKLPYNKDQDVWMVAQKFIHDHELPQENLETIAQFIIKNTGGPSRVVQSSGGVWDPLTGGSAYRTGEDVPMEVVDQNPYFPCRQTLKFDAKNKAEGITKKLKEFNSEMPPATQIASEKLDRLHMLSTSDLVSTADDLKTLLSILDSWPADKTFPALDILRLAIINERITEFFSSKDTYVNVFNLFLRNMTSKNEKCLMLSARGLVNLFNTEIGNLIMIEKCNDVMLSISNNQLLPSSNKNVEIALSTLLVNYSVSLSAASETESQIQCINIVATFFLSNLVDSEAKFRSLVALGTLMKESRENLESVQGLSVKYVLQQWKESSDEPRVTECCQHIIAML